MEGAKLELGQTYLLTPAQRLVIRDLADFYPREVITCIDVGHEESIKAHDHPVWTESDGYVLPGCWYYQEYIPPAFSDSVRGRHYRTVRIELEELINTAKKERYIKYELNELAKAKAKRKTGKKRAKRKTEPKAKPHLELII